MAKSDKESLQVPYPTFGSKRFKQTLKSHKEVLDRYYAGFNEAKSLKGNYKIFLDTNVILRIYSTSFKARDKLLEFFNDYKDRIVLSSQVQWEFVKNRENVIITFGNEVTKTIPENFKTDILNNISNFQDKNKSKLVDYSDVDKKLNKLYKDAEILLKSIENAIQEKNISTNEILYKDVFIAQFQNLELLQPLNQDYIQALKSEFDEFLKQLEKVDFEKEAFKAFPGCYEKKEKSEDPYGDYLIYHEMLDYANKHSCDLLFLTYDVTKGDWMQKSKSPHLHYVENFYLNTGQLIYILDGQRTFDDLLDINFKSLIRPIPAETSEINIFTLNDFLKQYPPLQFVPGHADKIIVEELWLNGYSTIESLESALNKAIPNIPLITAHYPHFQKLGYLRACMYMVDDNYKQLQGSQFVRSPFESLDL